MGVVNSKNYIPYCKYVERIDRGDNLIISNSVVYDITQYVKLNKHPGGPNAIIKASKCKKDVKYDMKMHSKGTKSMLKGMKIGTLVKCCKECNICSIGWKK